MGCSVNDAWGEWEHKRTKLPLFLRLQVEWYSKLLEKKINNNKEHKRKKESHVIVIIDHIFFFLSQQIPEHMGCLDIRFIFS